MSGTGGEIANPLELSDEDFLKQDTAPAVVADDTGSTGSDAGSEGGADDDKSGSGASDANAGAGGDADDKSGKTGDGGASGDGGSSGAEDAGKAEGDDASGAVKGDESKDKGGADGAQGGDDKSKAKGADGAADPVGSEKKDGAGAEGDAPKIFQVPTSFQANGKTIELKNEQEALQLMQMGANYTRKMQELVPHRKMLMMLQNNGLMDEGKLSFLIDLDKKDPEAIKKLIKDSDIDPLDIDTTVEPTYRAGNHTVSDDEAGFRTVLSDLSADTAGKETLVEINSRWDEASKEVLWKSPEIMTVIHEQRGNGVYDSITAEMDRRITLGTLPANTPFLQAYKTVGDEMATAAIEAAKSSGGGQSGSDDTSNSRKEPQVIDTRIAAPKSKVGNDDQASAASPTRSSPSKAKGQPVNPLSLSDDDFLKQMENRV